MFNRKKIVIGETYLFDVLSETNMANLVSLVTVVKKTKHNKYAVVSVNNGYVFETKAKYLTPYVDPEKATIVRCQYGTTDFDRVDANYFDLISSTLEIFEGALKDNTDECSVQMIKDFAEIRELGNNLKDKIQRYIDISDYKDSMEILGCAYKNLKDKIDSMQSVAEEEPNPLLEKPIEQGNFRKYFDTLVSDYSNGVISLDDFLTVGMEIIKDNYPKNYLINHGVISNDEIDYVISNILSDIHISNSIGFIIGMDDNDNWHLKTVYFTEDSDVLQMLNDFKNFIYNIYPELEKNGKCNPKYRFNVIAVRKRGDDEEDE